MKNTHSCLTSVLVLMLGLSLVACGETNQPGSPPVPNYQASMISVSNPDVEIPISSTRVGDILFQQYKLGTIKDCFIQNITTPVEQNGSLEALTFTLSTVTATSISKGISKTISTTKTIEITDSTQDTISWGIETGHEVLGKASVGANIALLSANANVSKTYNIAAKVGETASTTHAETIAESTTETVNSSYDITKIVEKTQTFSLQYNMKGYEAGHIYALAMLADVTVYQVIAIDVVRKEFYTAYFIADYDENQAYIKMLSSDDRSYKVSPEKQLSPITQVTIPTGDLVNFSGGTGTEQDPYLIANVQNFKNIRISPKSYFKLTTDIGAVEAISSFDGVFDGNGRSIKGIKIDTTVSLTGALFETCNGIVKDVIVSDSTIKIDTQGSNAISGIIVGELFENGKVLNCKVIDCELNISARDKNDTEGSSRYAIVGGVVGKCSGEVSNCEVIRTSLYGCSKKHDIAWSEGWNEAAYVYVGGIVGEIVGGSVHDNTVTALERLEGYAEYRGNCAIIVPIIYTRSRICLGGIIGLQNDTSSTQSNNKCRASVETFIGVFNSYNEATGIKPVEELYKNEIVAYVS